MLRSGDLCYSSVEVCVVLNPARTRMCLQLHVMTFIIDDWDQYS